MIRTRAMMAAFRKHKINWKRGRSLFALLAITGAIVLTVVTGKYFPGAHAACPPLQSSFGTVTNTFTVTSAGNYRVWVRIKTADVTKNSVTLQVDDTTCGLNIQASGIQANTWMWVGSIGGVATNQTTVTLPTGQHTVAVAGTAGGIMIDRVILTQDLACTPTGVGDNCAFPPDTTSPSVSITAPAPNATIPGAFTVAATATDDTSVSKVEFYVDNVLKATDTTAPYTYSAPAGLSAGSHSLMAKAYDSSNNNASSTTVPITVSGTVPPAALPADINADGVVDLLDFSVLASNFNKSATASTNARADINTDGVVNLLDFSALATNYGKHQ